MKFVALFFTCVLFFRAVDDLPLKTRNQDCVPTCFPSFEVLNFVSDLHRPSTLKRLSSMHDRGKFKKMFAESSKANND